MTNSAQGKKSASKKPNWLSTLKSITRPKVAIMLALGFSSGLPFMLVGNTLGYWLRESGIALATIGFLSWVGLAYSLKFLWAPLIDKLDAPFLGTLGRRRSWMLASQILIGLSLLGMSYVKPEGGLLLFTGLAALAAFASATQDIVIDAWRIEISDASEDMALLSSSYQLGYRASLLVTDAVILIIAGSVGWALSYSAMGALMAVGIVATLFAIEPTRQNQIDDQSTPLLSAQGIFDAVAGPFVSFFRQHSKKAFLILAAVCLYRLSDFVMGPMANPFYSDLGLTKETVGAVRGSVGLIASIVGVAAAGIFAIRFGFISTLLLGAVIGPASNLGFSLLAFVGPSAELFTGAMIVDNFATGFAGTALVGYMSSLTTLGYTATQYALLSSFYALLGKVLKGFSGLVVQKLSETHPLMESYAIFFVGTALIGIPAFLLCVMLVRSNKKQIS